MKNIVPNILYLLFVVFLLSGCAKDTNGLVGKWERFSDQGSGTILHVEKVGDNSYEGKLTHVAGVLTELGFEQQEVKWKSISKTGKKKYQGQDLQKAVDDAGKVARVKYIDVQFELVSEDIMYMSGDSTNNEFVGTKQKWRRLKMMDE